MYVEISPRQSGKTTRLIEALVSHLRQNDYDKVAIIASNISRAKFIKEKVTGHLFNVIRPHWIGSDNNFRLLVNDYYLNNVVIATDVNSLVGERIDYYFFDDFSSIEPRKLLFEKRIIENGYYCTTPCQKRSTINMITNHCLYNNIEIKFFNPWNENKLKEQEGFADYIREHILNEWVEYMESIGMDVAELKENWIPKWVRKHNFI